MLRISKASQTESWIPFVALLAAFIAPQAQSQSSGPAVGAVLLTISGNVPAPLKLTSEEFMKLPHQDVEFHEHDGTKAIYSGVPILTLLQKVGAPSGKQLKGEALASYVLASARDGYKVTFTLAELDPEIRNSTVLVADTRDGKALGDQVGPLRIIAVSDKKPVRSVRMLTSLEVVLLRRESNKEQ